jgi:hypothetical protein
MKRLLRLLALAVGSVPAIAQQNATPNRGETGYLPVDLKESFSTVLRRRYDLGNHAAKGVTQSRGKPVQEGVRAKLRRGTWEQLANTSPDEIRSNDLFPLGFMPLPHPNHPLPSI